MRTLVIGTTEEGRDILVAVISSESNISGLEVNRQQLKRLADPRGLSAAEAQRIIASTKPHYHLTGGLHSGETNPPEALMELAYRLAVSEEPYIRQIRDNVVVSIAPSTDVDGRDRYVDWYYAYKIQEAYDGGENYGGPPYWGKYVFHDNNRDINYGVDSLRAHLNWYLHWVPPIWHDLHEAQTLLYTFSGQPPQNPNLDPILYSELPFFATYEVNKLTGVRHARRLALWLRRHVVAGYLGFAAANHNGMLRMYEIFNQGGANTKKARLQGAQTTRQWYRPAPGTRRRSRLVDSQLHQLRADRRSDRARTGLQVPVDDRRELLSQVAELGRGGQHQSTLRVRHSRRSARSNRSSIASSICCAARPSKCIGRREKSRSRKAPSLLVRLSCA